MLNRTTSPSDVQLCEGSRQTSAIGRHFGDNILLQMAMFSSGPHIRRAPAHTTLNAGKTVRIIDIVNMGYATLIRLLKHINIWQTE